MIITKLDGKRVAVTGSGGFIGSHLTEALVAKGCDVTALVRYNSKFDFGFVDDMSPEVKEALTIVQGDLKDPDCVRRVVKDADAVFHLGAMIAIPYSYAAPRETIETNILGTLNVLMAAKDYGTPRVVHTSTSEVYGSALQVPINESHPLQGQSPYSASKIGADKIVESFHLSFEMPIVTVRPFNTYGPRQSARAVIPTIITQALTKERLALGKTDTTRDFNFVTDTAAGFIALAESDKAIGETVNLGTGVEIPINDIVTKVNEITGLNREVYVDEKRLRPSKSEVLRLCADNSKAKELSGWEPKVNIDEGLRITVDWIKDHLDLYRPGKYQI